MTGSVDDAYRACAVQVRQAGSSFYYGMRTLPAPKRRAIYAVYAWTRLCDDAVDDFEGEEAERRLTLAEDTYESALGQDWADAADPVSVALGDAVRRFGLSDRPFRALVRGMRMDLSPRAYQTFEDLELYCRRVAGAVGILCIEIFGYSDLRARKLAVQMGVALQITNILRDLREDALRGRIYLPVEDMRRYGVSADDVMGGTLSEAMVELLSKEAARAQARYDEANGLFSLVSADSCACLGLLYDVYSLTLNKIEQAGYDVWSRPVGLSAADKLRLLRDAAVGAKRPAVG